MNTREEVLAWLKAELVELLEIDGNSVTPDATLADLDVDSIDAVDIVVHFRELTGRRVEPEVFRNVRTVGDVVEALYGLVRA